MLSKIVARILWESDNESYFETYFSLFIVLKCCIQGFFK